MLMGEHAVLYGRRALVAAVERYITVRLVPRRDEKVVIFSELGQYETTLEKVALVDPFKFVLQTVRELRQEIARGFELHIESQFSHTLGLGSSAAVTVATLAALGAYSGRNREAREMHNTALRVVREVQGVGSGADLAASIFGGVVEYRADPCEIEALPGGFPLTVVYSGHKVPTPEVIRQVAARQVRYGVLYAGIYDLMDRAAEQAGAAIKRRDWKQLGELMNLGQGLMAALGVSTARLEKLLYELRSQDDIFGAKISGSGLGDCVIGLGEAHSLTSSGEALEIRVAQKGVQIANQA